MFFWTNSIFSLGGPTLLAKKITVSSVNQPVALDLGWSFWPNGPVEIGSCSASGWNTMRAFQTANSQMGQEPRVHAVLDQFTWGLRYKIGNFSVEIHHYASDFAFFGYPILRQTHIWGWVKPVTGWASHLIDSGSSSSNHYNKQGFHRDRNGGFPKYGYPKHPQTIGFSHWL